MSSEFGRKPEDRSAQEIALGIQLNKTLDLLAQGMANEEASKAFSNLAGEILLTANTVTNHQDPLGAMIKLASMDLNESNAELEITDDQRKRAAIVLLGAVLIQQMALEITNELPKVGVMPINELNKLYAHLVPGQLVENISNLVLSRAVGIQQQTPIEPKVQTPQGKILNRKEIYKGIYSGSYNFDDYSVGLKDIITKFRSAKFSNKTSGTAVGIFVRVYHLGGGVRSREAIAPSPSTLDTRTAPPVPQRSRRP